MTNWKIKTGNFLFKYRSFTPIPFMIAVAVLFKPVNLGEINVIVNLGGLVLSLFGESLRIIAVGYSYTGTSGRESYLRADDLNTSGIYSLVRNPLYIGNFFIFTGIVVVFSHLLALLVFAFFLLLQYYFIILAEENFLRERYGPVYIDYCRQVRRIIPCFKEYRKNENSFSCKKVIWKENDSLFNLFLMFLLVLLYKELRVGGRIHRPLLYIIPGGILILIYGVVKLVKKRESQCDAKSRD